MGKEKKKQLGVLGLVVALVLVLVGSMVFVGATAGWFDDPKVVIDNSYTCEEQDCEFLNLDAASYEELIGEKRSFIIFVDQPSCTTADRLRSFIMDWANEVRITPHKMMFEQLKESSLHEKVKYYPSIVIIDKGNIRTFLRADSDEDSEMYNNYDAFYDWMGKNIQYSNN